MSNIKNIAVGISRKLDLCGNIYSKKINMIYNKLVGKSKFSGITSRLGI
ncbi:MAG: hypothetical protein Q9M94_07640 [Candidatus Gracilibacteria bacterium]|nr:hypothetical protein [Candidatus Gracilibacteria bacterium]